MILHYINLIIISSFIISCESYRILAIFPFPGRSHFNVLEPVAKALARKGHQVDVMSHFPLKEPFSNYTDLGFPVNSSHARMDFETTGSPDRQFQWGFELDKQMCSVLGHPKVADLIRNQPSNAPYDALLLHIVGSYQCFAAVGHILNIPVIGVMTTLVYPCFQTIIGNPLNLAIAPSHMKYYTERMDFWQRLYNVIKTRERVYSAHKVINDHHQWVQKYLGDRAPDNEELEKSIALMFSNSHYTFHGIKPQTPGIIEIGGINVKNDTTALTPSLKQLLDESKHGFIYFSFGSLMATESLPIKVLNRLYEALRKVSPVKIIMRVPDPNAMPKNLPENVHIFTWLPQQRILEHPNIKAFVTHGGGLSSQETIFYKVPVVCIPFFAEQIVNCDIFSLKKMGVRIDIQTASQEDYDHAFREILENPVYRESIRKFSLLYWDRPLTPEESVTYWTEYIIRHGKDVLKSPAVNLMWWQLELLDVYAFILLCMIIAATVVLSSSYYLYRMLLLKMCSMKNAMTSKKSN